ncbi:hypothetical protein ACFL4A_00220 [bacterium]
MYYYNWLWIFNFNFYIIPILNEKYQNKVKEFRTIKQYKDYYYPNTQKKEVTMEENPELFGELLAKKALAKLEIKEK